MVSSERGSWAFRAWRNKVRTWSPISCSTSSEQAEDTVVARIWLLRSTVTVPEGNTWTPGLGFENRPRNPMRRPIVCFVHSTEMPPHLTASLPSTFLCPAAARRYGGPGCDHPDWPANQPEDRVLVCCKPPTRVASKPQAPGSLRCPNLRPLHRPLRSAGKPQNRLQLVSVRPGAKRFCDGQLALHLPRFGTPARRSRPLPVPLPTAAHWQAW